MRDEPTYETEATIRTVEEWAEAKGMLPHFIRSRPGGPKTPEVVRENQAFYDFAAAKGHGNWPVGKEMTEDEFDRAVAAALPVTHG